MSFTEVSTTELYKRMVDCLSIVKTVNNMLCDDPELQQADRSILKTAVNDVARAPSLLNIKVLACVELRLINSLKGSKYDKLVTPLENIVGMIIA